MRQKKNAQEYPTTVHRGTARCTTSCLKALELGFFVATAPTSSRPSMDTVQPREKLGEIDRTLPSNEDGSTCIAEKGKHTYMSGPEIPEHHHDALANLKCSSAFSMILQRCQWSCSARISNVQQRRASMQPAVRSAELFAGQRAQLLKKMRCNHRSSPWNIETNGHKSAKNMRHPKEPKR